MTSTDANPSTSIQMPEAGTVDMKLEVVTLPVSDVDRAKRFYQSLGRLEFLRPFQRVARRLVERDAVAGDVREEVLSSLQPLVQVGQRMDDEAHRGGQLVGRLVFPEQVLISLGPIIQDVGQRFVADHHQEIIV